MKLSRLGAGQALLVLLALSIDGDLARSQGGSGSGSAVDTPATPANPDDEDTGTSSPATGSALVAPLDPTSRLSWLRNRFSAAFALRPLIARAKVAYAVIDLTTGKELVSHDPDKGLNLASNAKLLTSMAALSALGGGFRWRTAVFAAVPDATGTVAGDLYIRGRGDPVLSVEHLRKLAAEVKARGIHTIEGRLVVDAGYFDGVTEPPHFGEQPNEHAGFRAPISSFAVAQSSYTVEVVAEPDGAARVRIDPELPDYLTITKQEVTSVTEGRTRLRVDAKRKQDRVEIEVTGTIRRGGGSWDPKRRVDDPTRFAAEVFKKALADEGVRLKQRSIALGPVPVSARLVAAHDSPTLADVLRAMNKHSDNNIAETVLKTLGAETKTTAGACTWTDATDALHTQLAKLGLVSKYRCENGSGLYASTEVSAHQLVSLLAAAHKDYRIGPDLVASLPVGGQDGTLARRWVGKPAQGRVRAKTGTLDKVSTLSGFIGVDSGHLLAFAILANDIPAGQRGVVRAMADEMVDSLAAYLDAKP